ncbi:mechanosensitive ion channel [bacterium]|nr:mechanosensitive ion channel [bacterium]
MVPFFELLIPDAAVDFFTRHPSLLSLLNIAVLIIASLFAALVAKKIATPLLSFFGRHAKLRWFDTFMKNNVFTKLFNAVPSFVIFWAAHYFSVWHTWLLRLAGCVLVVVFIDVARMINKSILEYYETLRIAKSRPIKGLMQIAMILVYCFGAIVIVSILLEKSPLLLLSGLGAMSAVIMLIFHDTILGLVAGVQITANQSIKKGDWIAMPQYGADGEVIDIALHTIRVRNWDNTIVFVPTHKFLGESFVNWSGMTQSGGRQILRSLLVDVTSIRYLTDEECETLRKIGILKDFIDEMCPREGSRASEPQDSGLTNIGAFREYARAYLRSNENLRQDMMLQVRQLPQTQYGLPIQIYAFSKLTASVQYESLQADIFDHLFAVVGLFGLRLYQSPSSYDIRDVKIGENN